MKKAKQIFSKLVLLVFFWILTACNNTSIEYPFQNPKLPVEERIDDLLNRMTLEEKASQLVYESPAIERLGIPEYNWWNECLHGVGRAGLATVFPQAIGMAAMFDKEQLFANAVIISDEARAKHHEAARNGQRGIYQGLTFWTPNINIFRDPRWGRGMETYGEDPFLTGELAVEFIKGLQGNNEKYLKLVATAKHFVVHSGPEYNRHTFDALVNKRDFFETYAPHFKRTIDEAQVESFMCAYNRLDGEPCCGSGYLLNDLLREQWGFKGYVVSDCWALVDFYKNHKVVGTEAEAAAMALKSGTDLNCGSVYPSLVDAINKGLVDEMYVDESLRRLLHARFKLGMFDPEPMVPFAQIPYEVVNSDKHKEVALLSAQKSMVLLKNEQNLLPLSKNLKTIAVIGPNANDEEMLLGNYNGHPEKAITPLQGIVSKLGNTAEVLYAKGCDLAENLPFLQAIPAANFYLDAHKTSRGLTASFYNNIDCSGDAVFSETHPQINFNWQGNAPVPQVPVDSFSIRWNGWLIPELTGEYYLGGDGKDGYRIWIDGEELVNYQGYHRNQSRYKRIKLEKGKPYQLQVDYTHLTRSAMMKLVWARTGIDLEQEALELAIKADVVVLCMGLSPQLEGEEMEVAVEGFKGGDRLTLGLPETQTQLIRKIHATGRPVVLVLLNGSALSVNWEAKHIPAILEAWYPGQAGGTAIADVLFGDYNPAGRLPVTFYKSENQLPDFEDYAMQGRTYRFFKGEPLFSFGHGLSYTQFEYSDFVLPQKASFSQPLTLSVKVTNTGRIAGDEVVQLYVKDVEASVTVPLVSLQGLQRIHLKPGESKMVSFMLTSDQLVVFDEDGCAKNEAGVFEISVGGKAPYQKGFDAQTTQVLTQSVWLE
ncbi:MAG: glycoside hydrolase family 3 C-terminal domain-containing protein [Salinivirgaceae bacterium]